MSTINQINTNIDQTVRVFDRFYDYSADVPAYEYDQVLSYFKSVFTTVSAAENFTSAIFQVAQESGESALTLLQTFQGQSQPQLTVTLCYYLNSIRSPATLLGVLTPTVPNYYTARNVQA
jgi:hypothetical protein